MKVEEVIYYKNVPGLMDKDPLVPGGEGAVLFKNLSYEQAQEIIGKGTGRGLLHELSIPLLQRYGIPIWIKDFNNPDAHGTRIGN
jgi:aspartokinase